MSKKIHAAWAIVCAAILFLSGCSELTKANVRLDQNKYDEAIPLFEAYLENHPESVEAMAQLGFAYFKIGFLDEAIEQFQAALGAKPGEPYATLYLGLAYLSKGEIDKAINMLEGYRNKKQPLVEAVVESELSRLKAEKQRIADGLTSPEDVASQFESSVKKAMLKEKESEESGRDSGGSDGGGCGC